MGKNNHVKREKILIVIAGIIVTLGAIGYLMTQQPPTDGISTEKAQNLLSQGALAIDLRSPGEYATGHIQDAINIPYDGCWACFEEVVATYPKNQIVLLYQNSGYDIAQYISLLMKEVGFTHVYFLTGGYQDWIHTQK